MKESNSVNKSVTKNLKAFFDREALLNTAVYLAWIFDDSKTVTISYPCDCVEQSENVIVRAWKDAAGGISISKFALV